MGYEERIPAQVRITCTPGVMSGMPCIDGTRVPAETILACINADMSVYEIYSHYSWLPSGAVEAVVDWAVREGRAVSLPLRRMPDARFGRGC